MAARKSKISDGRVRQGVRLKPGLEKSLRMYVGAAAGAASLLAVSSAAEAKIVYTPANMSIPTNGVPVPLDLNHDGIADFSFLGKIWRGSSGSPAIKLNVAADNKSNAIWGRGSFYGYVPSVPGKGRPPRGGGYKSAFASALRAGFKVGTNKSCFGNLSHGLLAWSEDSRYRGPYFYGQWNGYTQHRYLGFKFIIAGELHYGWARLNVTANLGITATITGYAYETVPNKPIITGKTKGPDVVIFEPASLGHLAQGASGMAAWRTNQQPAGAR